MTRPFRSYARAVSPALAQTWQLFSPDLNNVASETVVTVRFRDGTESAPLSMSRRFRDISLRGPRRWLPSRYDRMLEGTEVALNQAEVVHQRLEHFRELAREGTEPMRTMAADPRFVNLASVNDRERRTALVRYQRVVRSLVPLMNPSPDVVEIRARLLVSFDRPHRRLTELRQDDPLAFLEALEQEVSEEVLGGRAVLADTGWFSAE